MDTWVDSLHSRADIIHDQIAAALMAQQSTGVDVSGLLKNYRELLREIYSEGLPLADLHDRSDIIMHAEGPAAQHHASSSSMVAWLCSEAQKRFSELGVASLHLIGEEAKRVQNNLKVLLNGVAPGSLYLGFSVDTADNLAKVVDLLMPEKEEALTTVRRALGLLTWVPEFVGNESVSREFAERVEDPVLRDAALMAAYHLAPTGHRGIHTLELSAPRQDSKTSTLTNRERVVIRESALRRPILTKTKHGTFIGELREIDLDTQRFQLRNVPGVGTLRCTLGGLSAETARRHIGLGVKVTGLYEADQNDRPRLMDVELIEPYQVQQSFEPGDREEPSA